MGQSTSRLNNNGHQVTSESSFYCEIEILYNLSFIIKSVPKLWRSLRLLTPACILVLEAAVSTAEATETSEGVVDNFVVIYCRDPSKSRVMAIQSWSVLLYSGLQKNLRTSDLGPEGSNSRSKLHETCTAPFSGYLEN